MIPGEVIPADGDIVLNGDRTGPSIAVANTGDRPVQVGSHYHFAEVNAALAFDRSAARGCRLDIPAGTAVRFEAGPVARGLIDPVCRSAAHLRLQRRRDGTSGIRRPVRPAPTNKVRKTCPTR